MSADTHDAAWETLARTDPLWAICVRDSARDGGWDEAEFFASGRDEITWAMTVLGREVRNGPGSALAVDFGSGAGRLSRALLEHFAAVVGVDTSPTMRDLAARLTPDDALSVAPDLSSIGDASADLVYSSLVLQHLDRGRLPHFLGEFHRVLRPGASLLVQFPERPRLTTPNGIGFRLLPGRVVGWLQVRVLGYPAPMAMTWMPRMRFVELLRAAGFGGVTCHDGPAYSRDWHDAWYRAVA